MFNHISYARSDTPVFFQEEHKGQGQNTPASTTNASSFQPSRSSAFPPPQDPLDAIDSYPEIEIYSTASAPDFLNELASLRKPTLAKVEEIYRKHHGKNACAALYLELDNPQAVKPAAYYDRKTGRAISFAEQIVLTGCKVPYQDSKGKEKYNICNLAISYLAVRETYENLEKEKVQIDETEAASFGFLRADQKLFRKAPSFAEAIKIVRESSNSEVLQTLTDEEYQKIVQEEFSKALFQYNLGFSNREIADFAISKEIAVHLEKKSVETFQILLSQPSSQQAVIGAIHDRLNFGDHFEYGLNKKIFPELLKKETIEEMLGDASLRQTLLSCLCKRLPEAEISQLKAEAVAAHPALSEKEIFSIIAQNRYGALSNAALAELLLQQEFSQEELRSFLEDDTFYQMFLDIFYPKFSLCELAEIAMTRQASIPPHRLDANAITSALGQKKPRKEVLKQIYNHPASSEELLPKARKKAKEIAERRASMRDVLESQDFFDALAVKEVNEEFEKPLGISQAYVEIVNEFADEIFDDLLGDTVRILNELEEKKKQRLSIPPGSKENTAQ